MDRHRTVCPSTTSDGWQRYESVEQLSYSLKHDLSLHLLEVGHVAIIAVLVQHCGKVGIVFSLYLVF